MSIFLETNRLILKHLNIVDLDNLFVLRADPEVMKYIGRGEIQTKENVEHFLNVAISYQEKYGFGFCSVFEKESGEFIGQAGLFHVGFADEKVDVEIISYFYKKFETRSF